MVDWNKEVERLERARERACEMGGSKRIQRQHDLCKLTVRERIDHLIDPRETRPVIIRHLEFAHQRRKEPLGPMVKHGIMP